MPVPSSIADLSQTAGSNSPPGSESPITADEYLRVHASYHAQHRDGKGFTAEVDVASAGTCDIGAANSLFVRITGTTTITSFGTPSMPGPRHIRFAGALTLTHNASTLILPGSSNITTAAGDTCIARPISGGWVVSHYTRADGKALIGALTTGTAVSLSGTSVDVVSSIPSWVKRITIPFVNLQTNGTAIPIVQLGDSGGVETGGYLGVGSTIAGGSTSTGVSQTTGFGMSGTWAATVVAHGSIVLHLVDSATNTWQATINLFRSDAANSAVGGGSKSLSGALTSVRLTTVGGSNTLSGTTNYLYE